MTPAETALLGALEAIATEIRVLRRQLEAVIKALVPMETLTQESAADAPCGHPEDRRVSMASAGNEDFFCKACDALVSRPLVAD